MHLVDLLFGLLSLDVPGTSKGRLGRYERIGLFVGACVLLPLLVVGLIALLIER